MNFDTLSQIISPEFNNKKLYLAISAFDPTNKDFHQIYMASNLEDLHNLYREHNDLDQNDSISDTLFIEISNLETIQIPEPLEYR